MKGSFKLLAVLFALCAAPMAQAQGEVSTGCVKNQHGSGSANPCLVLASSTSKDAFSPILSAAQREKMVKLLLIMHGMARQSH